MFSRLRLARFSSVLFCAFMGLSSLGWANEPRIAVSKSPLSLPFFVAKEKNLFAKHKVEPVLIECLGGNRCVKELTEGRVDMATSSELPFMFAVFQGKPISLVATFNTNKDDMKFVVRKAAVKIGTKGLVGKRIGYVEKASSHYYMDLFLLYNGIDPKTIVPVAMGADALAGALASGEVDAISVWEPWGKIALNQGGADVAVLDSPKLYSQTFNLLISNEYRLAQIRKSTAVLSALEDAIQFIKKNPDEAKSIMGRNVGIDADTVKAAWPTYQFELTLQQSLLSTVQGQARWARREGHVGAALPEPEFLNFVDSGLLRKIKPNAVDFVYP
ncbi:ABC transporter substrate-binding protein [Limnobacter sp.]|jgi:ABC-type nitrate/sulfonate/bicarbonate transport system substrate-binding protein|uniref:ABC transporter substrate-binding protein n=1 Tax=Limnobacter sp. TaxID=2003368 RepID=UPI0027370984|nr:ABC transporter substrate-binding protein [Limnobacter sp.]MDP3271828.1 ABC transporter substrate-binding protein [Limnobacter sp.]